MEENRRRLDKEKQKNHRDGAVTGEENKPNHFRGNKPKVSANR